jgi:arylsulfatase A-like enzyme
MSTIEATLSNFAQTHGKLTMPRRILLALTVFSLTTGHLSAAKPNIILIMCDDMGFSDIGCYGGEVKTPHIDRLAKEGMRFTQFYNNAKCTTTRASLITGLYPRQKGNLLKDNMVTIPQVLKSAGYVSALSGKWHLGANAPHRPSDRGFDRYYGLLDGCSNFFDPSMPDPDFKGGRVRVVKQDDRPITEFPDDFYMTDKISDYAVECIEDFSQTEKPFFLHVCYTAPHYPLHAKPEDISKYQGKYLAGWEKLRADRHKRQIEMGLIDPQWKLPGREREVGTWEEAPHKEWQDLRMAVYSAMIDSMDQGIGRILTTLDEKNLTENTVVMFLSDNGGCAERPGGDNPNSLPGPKEYYTHCGPAWAWASNTPFRRYKSHCHEGGIATPLIVRWPGVVPKDSLTDEVGHIIDFLPTCADIAGAAYPETFAGTEILPVEGLPLTEVFQGGTREGHEWLFWEWAGTRGVRNGNWKLSWDKGAKAWELYDLVADRTETDNLAQTHPERVETMSEQWFAWATRTGLKIKK